MNWLWVILIGLIVGALAKLLTPGRDPGGFIVTTLLGIGGSLVATVLGRAPVPEVRPLRQVRHPRLRLAGRRRRPADPHLRAGRRRDDQGWRDDRV